MFIVQAAAVGGIKRLFSSHFLKNLYESIKNEPFKIPEDDGNDLTHTFFNPDREGWLLKLGEMMPAGPFCFVLDHSFPICRLIVTTELFY